MVLELKDGNGADMESCPHPKQRLKVQLSEEADAFDILRKKTNN